MLKVALSALSAAVVTVAVFAVTRWWFRGDAGGSLIAFICAVGIAGFVAFFAFITGAAVVAAAFAVAFFSAAVPVAINIPPFVSVAFLAAILAILFVIFAIAEEKKAPAYWQLFCYLAGGAATFLPLYLIGG